MNHALPHMACSCRALPIGVGRGEAGLDPEQQQEVGRVGQDTEQQREKRGWTQSGGGRAQGQLLVSVPSPLPLPQSFIVSILLVFSIRLKQN